MGIKFQKVIFCNHAQNIVDQDSDFLDQKVQWFLKIKYFPENIQFFQQFRMFESDVRLEQKCSISWEWQHPAQCWCIAVCFEAQPRSHNTPDGKQFFTKKKEISYSFLYFFIFPLDQVYHCQPVRPTSWLKLYIVKIWCFIIFLNTPTSQSKVTSDQRFPFFSFFKIVFAQSGQNMVTAVTDWAFTSIFDKASEPASQSIRSIFKGVIKEFNLISVLMVNGKPRLVTVVGPNGNIWMKILKWKLHKEKIFLRWKIFCVLDCFGGTFILGFIYFCTTITILWFEENFVVVKSIYFCTKL